MSEEEKVNQLVAFLDPLIDDRFKIKFTELSKKSKGDLIDNIQKLEDWALDLGVSEQKQLQLGKLLGILNDPEDDFCYEQYQDITVLENNSNNNSFYNNSNNTSINNSINNNINNSNINNRK